MKQEKELYTIKKCSRKDIEAGKISINDIISGNISGFVVSDFLNEMEISSLLQRFKDVNTKELIAINSSFNSYPMSFAQYDQMVQRNIIRDEDYFNVSRGFIKSFESRFGVDVFLKLKNVLKNIVGAPSLEMPENPDKSGQYVPFTFRELFPGGGCLKAHCENLFFQEFPSFFTKITNFSTLENQLSFFILLQKPDLGGELTLFDIVWNEDQKRPNDNEIIRENGITQKFDNVEDLKRCTIHPDAGSLVVFSGGKIWHRVESVISAPSRITLGGFLSFSKDGKKLFVWS